MALTPEQQRELEKLRAKKRRAEQRKREAERLQRAEQHLQKYRQTSGEERDEDDKDFNALRLISNIGRDTVRDAQDLAHDLSRTVGGLALGGPTNIGAQLAAPIASAAGVELPRLEIDEAQGTENAAMSEQLVRGIGSWLIPYTGAMKGLKGVRMLQRFGRNSKVASLARPMAAGFTADFVQGNAIENNMVNVLQDSFGLDLGVINMLASEEDDEVMMRRFKSAVSGTLMGVATDLALKVGGQTLKALKLYRGSRDEAMATLSNYENREPIRAYRPGKKSVEDKTQHSWRIVREGEPEPTTFGEAIDFLNNKAGNPDLTDKEFQDFAEALIRDDPENLLPRLGVDLENMDWEAFEDPEMMARVQDRLSEALDNVANRLGRTGQRVTMEETVRGAEALATSPNALIDLYKSTAGLASKLTAGRIIQGAHANHMDMLARKALKELQDSGRRGKAWDMFMRSFHRQGLILGTVTGASSEIGRALQSLRQGVSTAKETLQDAADAESADQAADVGSGKMTVTERVDAYSKTVQTDRQALELLNNVISLEGDIGQLNKVARQGENGFWSKLGKVGGELSGNLFTTFTAGANIVSGLGNMSLDLLGKSLAAIARAPGFLAGGRSRMEAQRAAMEAWAYGQKALAFGPPIMNALRTLKKDLASEAAMHLDYLGLEGLALKAEEIVQATQKAMTGDFERGDIIGRKVIRIPLQEQRKLDGFIEETFGQFDGNSIDRFFQVTLKALSRIGGTGINTVGTATRSGLSLFIHAPDQLVGTLAQQARGYSAAVREASEEAWELGLEGKEVTEFIKARTEELYAGGPQKWGQLTAKHGKSHKLSRESRAYAKDTLFQSDPETWIGKKATWLGTGFGPWLVPFVKTLIRIPERTVLDYSPLGLVKDRIRKAIAQGGSARDEALGRIGASVMAIMMAYNASSVIGRDGGWNNTARDANRPSYSVDLGGASVGFGMVEPVGSLMGFAADLREHQEAVLEDPTKYDESKLQTIAEGAMLASVYNIFSKNWLQGVTALGEVLDADPTNADGRLEKFLGSFTSRMAPGAGVQKALVNAADGKLRESRTPGEKFWAATILAPDKLPEKMDTLGRPILRDDLERFMGLKGGTHPTDETDLLMAELGELNIRDFRPNRKQDGVKLSSEQYSRFLELRGGVVRDQTGMTMQEKLKVLFSSPAYQAAPDGEKEKAIRKHTRGFNTLAKEALTAEDQDFGRGRVKNQIFEQAKIRGWSAEQRDAMLGLALEIFDQRFNAQKPKQ